MLAAARALGRDAARFCAARAPALERPAAALDDPAALARESAALARPEPLGLERVDRSWYAPPPRSRRGDGATHLQRAAYAHLVSMDGDDAAALSRRAPEEITRALAMLGRRRLALAFAGAPRAGLAQLCARLGEPAAGELVAEVRALKSAAPPEAIKAAQRALFRSGDDLDGGGELFLRLGAAWLAPALAPGGDELSRVAQRLPRSVGQLLLDEADAPLSEPERAAALALLADAVL